MMNVLRNSFRIEGVAIQIISTHLYGKNYVPIWKGDGVPALSVAYDGCISIFTY